jgi:sensor histidine kinase YesM
MEKIRKLITFSKESGKRSLLENYFKLLFIWSPLVSFLFVFGFNGFENFFRNFINSFSIAFTCGFICMSGTYLVEFLYHKIFQKLNRTPPPHGPLWGVSISYLFIVPALFFGFKVAANINLFLGYQSETPDFADYRAGLLFGVLVSSLFLLFEIIRESKVAKQDAELKFRKLENENLKAQVSALSAQMNPHLLFNALNTIASTIESDPSAAEEMIVQLSELYRGILKSAKDETHSLENEIALCKAYLEIEKKRFGSRVQYNIEIIAINPAQVKLPVLLIQPLIENAVKHGLAPIKSGGKIRIEVKKNQTHMIFRVIDNGVGPSFTHTSNGTGSGLSNCESRIRLRYGADSNFSFTRSEDQQTIVAFELPLRELAYD